MLGQRRGKTRGRGKNEWKDEKLIKEYKKRERREITDKEQEKSEKDMREKENI